MPEIIPTGPFDLSFDATFRGLLPATGNVTAPDCYAPGVYLCWLSPVGWCYYLFAGNADTDLASRVVANFTQAGLQRATQRISQKVMSIRAGGMSRGEADVVSTVLKSVKVYAMAPDATGQIRQVPVYVDADTVATWRDSQSRINMEIKIRFPEQKSTRA